MAHVLPDLTVQCVRMRARDTLIQHMLRLAAEAPTDWFVEKRRNEAIG